MDIIVGKKVHRVDRWWVVELLKSYHEHGIAIDLGAGDGSYVYKTASKAPNSFFIGIDSNAENLREYSLKASRQPKKGGLPNVMYVHAGVENLPEELEGVASSVTVILPWGSLLQAVAKPDIAILKNIAQLCRSGAHLRVVFGYEVANEQNIINQLDLPLISASHLDTMVCSAYLEAGFSIKWRYLPQVELKNIPSTWAKKLAYGKTRQFIEIMGEYFR